MDQTSAGVSATTLIVVISIAVVAFIAPTIVLIISLCGYMRRKKSPKKDELVLK